MLFPDSFGLDFKTLNHFSKPLRLAFKAQDNFCKQKCYFQGPALFIEILRVDFNDEDHFSKS